MIVVYHVIGVMIAPANHPQFKCYGLLLCVTCDLPAKAAILNFNQFNGYWGCARCLQEGTTSNSSLLLCTVCMFMQE